MRILQALCQIMRKVEFERMLIEFLFLAQNQKKRMSYEDKMALDKSVEFVFSTIYCTSKLEDEIGS
jgi:hypothetical protein